MKKVYIIPALTMVLIHPHIEHLHARQNDGEIQILEVEVHSVPTSLSIALSGDFDSYGSTQSAIRAAVGVVIVVWYEEKQ